MIEISFMVPSLAPMLSDLLKIRHLALAPSSSCERFRRHQNVGYAGTPALRHRERNARMSNDLRSVYSSCLVTKPDAGKSKQLEVRCQPRVRWQSDNGEGLPDQSRDLRVCLFWSFVTATSESSVAFGPFWPLHGADWCILTSRSRMRSNLCWCRWILNRGRHRLRL